MKANDIVNAFIDTEKACAEINKRFGLNVSVKLSDDYKQLEEPQTAEEQKEYVDYSF